MLHEKFRFSADFQDTILACMLRHPDIFSVHSEIIQAKFFSGSAAYDACAELKEYSKKYSKMPSFTVLGNLVYKRYVDRNPDRAKEAVEYIQRLAAIDTADAAAIRDMVLDFAKERAIQGALKTAMEAHVSGSELEGGIVKLFEDALSVGSDLDDIGIWLHTDMDAVREKLENPDFGVKTGFRLLDKLWKRGWGKGWLIVPLAPPKRLKSTWCLNLALSMAGHGVNASVFYYACEISQELAFMRGLINVTGLPESLMYETPETFWDTAKREVPEKINGNIMFKSYAAGSTSIAKIIAHAKNVIKKTGVHPKAIIIDYAETVAGSSEKTTVSDWKKQAGIYTEARAMGGELGCCIIMPDRCNAETVDKKVPNMKSFQGAFEKAGIVDVAIGLCATNAEYLQNVIRYFVFLNRHGPQYLHYRGKVDPDRYRMTIDEQIEYNPDEDETPSNYRAKQRPKPSKADVKRGIDGMNEDD